MNRIRWQTMLIVLICAFFSLGGTFTCTSGSDEIVTKPAK